MANLHGALGNAGEHRQHMAVHLAGVGLAADGHHLVKAHLARRSGASTALTFAASPPNSSMKLAWVPVVPLTPSSARAAS